VSAQDSDIGPPTDTRDSDAEERLAQLVARALELPPDSREQFLDEACAGQESPRARADLALRGRVRSHDVLEASALQFAAPLIAAVAGHATDSPAADDELFVLRSSLAERYRVDRELGRGGMAVVYLAEDLRHHRKVALKVLSAELAHSLGAERFSREIETAAGLVHPHILPLHDSGEAAGRLYYTMPFVEGESLRDRLVRDRQLPIDVALRYAREVADALAFAHRRGIVHRDIKPANILLIGGASTTGVGEPVAFHAVVADFGIARAIDRAGRDGLTATGLALGTPAYVSPEQATGDAELNGRSDIYSLGCVLYEMLTGQQPFTGPTAQVVITRRLAGPPPRIRDVRPTVPPEVDELTARAMAPLPADRQQTADELVEALGRAAARLTTTADGRRSNERMARSALKSRSVVAAVGVLTLALALTVGLTRWARRDRSLVAAGASTIAVIPFGPAVADSALRRLGRELAITIGWSLDGVGGIRAVDPLTVLANVRESSEPPSRANVIALGKRLGASSVVYGTLVRDGDRARVDAALYPVAGGNPLASATVRAPPSDVTALTDSTTWALLSGIWRATNPPTPSLASLTTHSVPALKAFLEGERLIAGGQWRPAAAAFERAFRQDSTFWMGYWRYAFVRAYYVLPVDSAITARFRAHRGDLPERDRLLVEAFMTDSLGVRYERVKAAAARFPDYWPAWWTLSEQLAHSAPLFGTNGEDLRSALEQTLTINPGMAPAWQHLFWVAMWERDTILSARVLRALTSLHYDSLSREEQGFDELLHFRYLDALARSGGVLRDSTLAEPGVRLFISMARPVGPHDFSVSPATYGFPRQQVMFSRAVLARHPSPTMATAMHVNVAVAQAARGAWDSALVAVDSFVSHSPDMAARLYRYRLAVVSAWLGATDAGLADGYRPSTPSDSATASPSDRSELAWLDGLLAVARRDGAGVAAARRVLHAVRDTQVTFLDRSLAAFQRELAGQRDHAADSLRALELERAELGWSRYRSEGHPFLTAVNRLAAARWLLARGDAAEASRLLTWCEAFFFPLRLTREANVMVQGLAYLERARVAAAMQRPDLAGTYYRRFLWHYDAPASAHRHLVDEARQALARSP